MSEDQLNEAAETATQDDLEAEGDLAADYIEGLLDLADLDGDLDMSVASGRAYLSVTGGGEDLDRLAMPETVQALQDLTRIAVQNQTGRFSRLILDIGGSRDARAIELRSLVDAAIAQIAAGRTEVELEPMSSYERKLVHDIVSDRGLISESYGDGAERHTVLRRA